MSEFGPHVSLLGTIYWENISPRSFMYGPHFNLLSPYCQVLNVMFYLNGPCAWLMRNVVHIQKNQIISLEVLLTLRSSAPQELLQLE